MKFTEYHNLDTPVIICNVWDVSSAKIAEELNFKAIGTSSAAIATMLGYKDGEEMSFKELEYIVSRIVQSCSIPLTVDLEAGYSRKADEIIEHIKRLKDLGVVGINLEDSVVDEERKIIDKAVFAKTLNEICSQLNKQNYEMFINVRTDTYILQLQNPLAATLERAKLYSNAGANGLFVPCIVKEEEIKVVVEEINLPLNVMCMPNLPNFETLQQIGVKRISMGNFVYNNTNALLKNELTKINENKSFHSLFE